MAIAPVSARDTHAPARRILVLLLWHVQGKQHAAELHRHVLQRQLHLASAPVGDEWRQQLVFSRLVGRWLVAAFCTPASLLLVPVLGPAAIALQQFCGRPQLCGHGQVGGLCWFGHVACFSSYWGRTRLSTSMTGAGWRENLACMDWKARSDLSSAPSIQALARALSSSIVAASQ